MRLVIATNIKTEGYELHREGCAHIKLLFPHYINGPQEYESILDALAKETARVRANGGDTTEITVAACLRPLYKMELKG